MIRNKALTMALVLSVVAGLALLAGGCATTKKEAPFPKTVEATVQVAPAEPDKIEYIEVTPWTIKPGEKADISIRGSKDRRASASLTGVDGEAAGKNQVVDLESKEPGLYTGSITAGDQMPPGKYRIEGVLKGGPSGEPVKLVSSRALTVAAPPPPPPKVDACDESHRELLVPQIYFAYDKSDINDAAQAWIRQAAQKLAGLGGRVQKVTVEGHCDERGTVNYNLALGGRRAAAVKKALEGLPGMAGIKIDTLSKGKEEPVVPHAKTEEEHAKNRRAVFIIECSPAQ